MVFFFPPITTWRRTLISPLHGKVAHTPPWCQVPHWWHHQGGSEPFCRLIEGLLPLLLQGCHLQIVSHVIFKWNIEVSLSLSPESHHIELLYFFHWDAPLRSFPVKLSNLCRDTGFACCGNPFCQFSGHMWIWTLSERTVIRISGKCFWQSSRCCSI